MKWSDATLLCSTLALPCANLPLARGSSNDPSLHCGRSERKRPFQNSFSPCSSSSQHAPAFVGPYFASTAAAAAAVRVKAAYSPQGKKSRTHTGHRSHYDSVVRCQGYKDAKYGELYPSLEQGSSVVYGENTSGERSHAGERSQRKEDSEEANNVATRIALPLGVPEVSRIIRVKVENLAMVDSVQIEVSGEIKFPCLILYTVNPIISNIIPVYYSSFYMNIIIYTAVSALVYILVQLLIEL